MCSNHLGPPPATVAKKLLKCHIMIFQWGQNDPIIYYLAFSITYVTMSAKSKQTKHRHCCPICSNCGLLYKSVTCLHCLHYIRKLTNQ